MSREKLQEAVEIFKELGWDEATITTENILTLPLGTKEQQTIAKEGLKTGAWDMFFNDESITKGVWQNFLDTKPEKSGWQNLTGADSSKLALFAIRLGVDTKRATSVLESLSGQGIPLFKIDNEILFKVIAERGEKFISSFVTQALKRSDWGAYSFKFAEILVLLITEFNLEIPQNANYIDDYSVYLAKILKIRPKSWEQYKSRTPPRLDIFEKSFAQHMRIGIAVNTPATSDYGFGTVFPIGIQRGWLSREEGIQLAFSGLDASVKSGERKAWIGILDELNITDEELNERIQSIIPILASGDNAVINRFAQPLITLAESNLLTEVLIASFSADTKKAKKMILKTALTRPCPENTEEIIPWLQILSEDKDEGIAKFAKKLIEKWGIEIEAHEEEKQEIQGLWQETPPLWTVPAFELGEVSPENLLELASKLASQPAVIRDITTEHFLAMINAVASENPETARTSLRGLSNNGWQTIHYVVCWVKEVEPSSGGDWYTHSNYDYKTKTSIESRRYTPKGILQARDYIVSLHLGKLPCILSMPSKVDLSITVPDLVARLALYDKANVNVLEADLFLALTRLDISTKTPKCIKALKKLDTPIIFQKEDETIDTKIANFSIRKKATITAGQVILAYIDDPLQEISIDGFNKYKYSNSKTPVSNALKEFPNRMGNQRQNDWYSVFPHWGDASLTAVCWSGVALVLRQVVRRASPLPSGAAMNLLGAQRSSSPQAQEDTTLAVLEAWERGLLRPNVADIKYLDWSDHPPSHLVALAEAFETLAIDGMLSVVWPLMDELIGASLKASRMITGTAELAELIVKFLPEVQVAIENGLTNNTALDLPNIRTLAKKSGSSRAVVMAKKVVALLPDIQEQDAENAQNRESKAVMKPPFEEIWKIKEKETPILEDGATVSIGLEDKNKPNGYLFFTLTIPNETERIFQITPNYTSYHFKNGRIITYPVASNTTDFIGWNTPKSVFINWDEKQKTLVVDDVDMVNKKQFNTLSQSMLTIYIGRLLSDTYNAHETPNWLNNYILDGQINDVVFKEATQTLLQSPLINPVKLARLLENNINLLYVFWPILTESIKVAANLIVVREKPPLWLNRILDCTLRYAPYLVEATKRNIIAPSEWANLNDIASLKSKSTAIAKAEMLISMFL